MGAGMAAQACGGTDAIIDGGTDGAIDDVTTIDVVTAQDSGADVVNNDDTGTTDSGGDATDGGTTIDSGLIKTWGCGSTTVTDCSLCIGHSMPCVYCANADASTLAGACVQEGTGCGGSTPNGYDLCACSKDAGASVCAESFEVCLPAGGPYYVCDTCGAVNTTNGLTCENGGKCNATDGGCN